MFSGSRWNFDWTGAPNSYRLKDRMLRQRAEEIQILALGSSHAAQGIRPDAFSIPLFNLANVSQSLILDEELFKRYLRTSYPSCAL